ncbi:hypothetical protein [Sulfuracidifex metallicus]|uniref:Uncharacterized protein n=1 Tax=Sulfuracidifex metallicus DSM 6482 = JCM 9184 TaxID=523847 RepID=A0A6A9QIT8_SULME|nr:hypothetical protein [Sulfuracidifex metallicus]MUN29197.1 hypothetical protein [Sulfuracidifex metallicus DSM 6482 = JCM 9184]WOE50284.1 hypothetical protein RQ359_001803 [Sulfuracidifex metallicus DSM 6482 = JCM 9184]
MDYFMIMRLGFYVSQVKRVEVGIYTITFSRRKSRNFQKDGKIFYVVTLLREGKEEKKGVFTEYSNAVIFAGELMSAFR